MTDVVKFALFVICMASCVAAAWFGFGFYWGCWCCWCCCAGNYWNCARLLIRPVCALRYNRHCDDFSFDGGGGDQVQSESSQSKRCSRHINAKSVLQIGSGWGQYTVYGQHCLLCNCFPRVFISRSKSTAADARKSVTRPFAQSVKYKEMIFKICLALRLGFCKWMDGSGSQQIANSSAFASFQSISLDIWVCWPCRLGWQAAEISNRFCRR